MLLHSDVAAQHRTEPRECQEVRAILAPDGSGPWTIIATGKDILLRSEDVIRLADRFLQTSGVNYSFADISIIDLAATLRERNRTVEILTFDRQLAACSG